MASNLNVHQRIYAYQTVSGNTDNTAAINEAASQTFLQGTPVQLNAGTVQAWDGSTVAKGILGISLQDASNYSVAGKGAPGVFGSVGSPAALVTFGKVPYEASAVNIPRGSPFVDGRTLFNVAVQDTLFIAQVDNSSFSIAADATPVQADIGKQFGLTVDSNGTWYVDRGKTTVGTNTVLVVVALDPTQGSVLNGSVIFRFTAAATQEVQ